MIHRVCAAIALMIVYAAAARPAGAEEASDATNGAKDAASALQAMEIGIPRDGPAIRAPRLTQADILSGAFSLKDLRRRGLEMFTTSFNRYDGYGDGTVGPDPAEFGQRPTVNGTWLRLNGLDSQTCQECHAFVSLATVPPTLGIAGVAGIANTAMPFVTRIDVADEDGSLRAEVNGRLINPPFLYGAGGVEQLGKEMTRDLQALKAQAQSQPGTPVQLVSKSVQFGSLSYSAAGGFDTSLVQGVDADLVVRPFGRKGEFATVRAFDVGALQFHMGMQAQEMVGVGVDDDEDGVVDEVLVGELSAMHIFGTTLERPVQVMANHATVRAGRQVFDATGCGGCHVPELYTESRMLPIAFPEVETDPDANVFVPWPPSCGTASTATVRQTSPPVVRS